MANPSQKPRENLIRARVRRGWSRRDVAREIGVSKDAYESWERGEHAPYPDHIHKLCDLFEMTAEELGLTKNPQNEPPPQSSADIVPSTPQASSEQNRRFSRRLAIVGLGLAGIAVVGGGIGGFVWLTHFRTSNPIATPTHRSPSQGTILYTYRGHRAGLDALAWSPDGNRIATASDDYTVQVWDATTGEHPVIYLGHSSYVRGVAWSPDNTRIVSGSADGTAQIWNAKTGQPIHTYHGHVDFYRHHPSAQGHPWVNRVSWSSDGTKIASCDQFSMPGHIASVQVWDAVTGKTITTYLGHTDGVYAVAWSHDGNRIASAGYDGTLQIWDAMDRTLLAYYPGNAVLFGLSWSRDDKFVAVGSADHTVQVVDSTTGNVFTTYQGHSDLVKDVAWSPNGKYIASGSDDGLVILWDTATSAKIFPFNGHSGHINAVGWSPTGKLVASGGLTTQVWQAL